MRKILTLILGVLGFFVSLKLSQIYFDANFMAGYKGSFCSINSVVDCDGVARSSYSTFLGIPWSLYGMLFYLMVIGICCLETLTKKFKIFKRFESFSHPDNYVYLMALFSVFLSLYLAWVSSFQIHKICLLCYVSYIINLALFSIYVSKLSIRDSAKVLIKDTKNFLHNSNNRKLFSILFMVAFALVFGANQTQVFVPKSYVHLFKGNVLGSTEAKAKIQVFSDYNCPYCSLLNNELYKLAHQLRDVKVELISFPLDKQCNPLMKKKDGHKGSCLAAKYAIAAKKQCKFLEFNSELFKENYNFSEEHLLQVAKKAGLDVDRIKEDAHSLEVEETLKEGIQRGLSIGVDSTPTIKVGMKVYNYFVPYEDLFVIVSEYKDAFNQTK